MDEKKIVDITEEVKDIFTMEDDDFDPSNEDMYDIMSKGITFESLTNTVGQTVKNIKESIVKSKPVIDEVTTIVEDVVPGAKEAIGIGKEIAKGVKKVEPVIEAVTEEFKQRNREVIKKKVESIETGDLVTSIYGDFENQKVIHGRVMSITDNGVTIMSKDKNVVDPKVIKFDNILDIFKVKRFKKKHVKLSIFKLKKAINEFIHGTEEEITKAYEQKISVKELRKKLRRKRG